MSTPNHRDHIVLTGAREHNLRNVTLRIPREQIVVFTGVSGSGKSSIVFDTIAIESQRQLFETFAPYIRNMLPKHEKPEADAIENLSTAIVIDQRPVDGNRRSTVGTMTDVYAALRVLFSRFGEPSAGPASAYSFNNTEGMCPDCQGLGETARVDLDRLLDTSKSLNSGAIRFRLMPVGGVSWQLYANSGLFDPDKPLVDYDPEEWRLLLYGKDFKVKRAVGDSTYNNSYEGIVEMFNRRYLHRDLSGSSKRHREAVQEMIIRAGCESCGGARLNPAALASRIDGRNIADHTEMEIRDLVGVLDELAANTEEQALRAIVAEATAGLRRIVDVGLGYLTLGRATPTLSGGEAQRLKTVRHLGSSLTGMTYIFDEPSIGLHPRDVHRLTGLLRQLRDAGNTVLVVEHDPDVIEAADHVIDIGPGAGVRGGQVVFTGTPAALASTDTITGRHLRRPPALAHRTRQPAGFLELSGANAHNLRDVRVRIPTGVLTTVTGPAGSGKSSLISGEFVRAYPDTVVVDQSGVGISARSTPASYLGVLDPVRKMFAEANGVDAGYFSFNSLGACPRCGGRGWIETDLAFMDPISTRCEECGGSRFRPEVSAYPLRGRTIVDVLAMTAAEAQEFFDADPGIGRRLSALVEVGLAYLTLGRQLGSLSGGERQRLKLANRLHERGTAFVLDEPTTGLHMADIETLLALLDRLVDAGNTVITIEHNLDVIARSDWIIDLGPEGGIHGGQVVFTGTPAELATFPDSATAEHLRLRLGTERQG